MSTVSRLYSCLANGSADEFQKGEHLFKAKAVKDALQIGESCTTISLHDHDDELSVSSSLLPITLFLIMLTKLRPITKLYLFRACSLWDVFGEIFKSR